MYRQISYKGLRHNVLNDAPFIGAIVIANYCHRACPGCINEHLKSDASTLIESADQILEQVVANGLNEGVIFSGLEWTEQAGDLEVLVKGALARGLKVMVYTHLEEEAFFERVPGLLGLPLYVKFGAYEPSLASDGHHAYGVKLATTNQRIVRYEGGDGIRG